LKRKIRRNAFTLVELMVVITILGLMVAIVTVALPKRITRARTATTKSQIYQFKNAISAFHLDTGMFPESLNDLIEKPTGEAGDKWDGPYLADTEIVPKDAWGRDFEYKIPGQGGRDYEIVSYGQDGKPGGEGADADILSWVSGG